MENYGPLGSVGMGCMFSVVKVRNGQRPGDYSNSGWFKHSQGTVAYELDQGPPKPSGPAVWAWPMPVQDISAKNIEVRCASQAAGRATQPIDFIPFTNPKELYMNILRNTTLSALTALAAAGVSASGNPAGTHSHDTADLVGKPGVSANVSRSIKVEMTDGMRFRPSSIDVRQDETVRLVVINAGQLKHELVLGTERELKEHYEAMKKNPQMEHADPSMVTLAAGKTGEVIWQFTKAGKVDFACLQPGHYDAGMKGSVSVAGPRAQTARQQ